MAELNSISVCGGARKKLVPRTDEVADGGGGHTYLHRNRLDELTSPALLAQPGLHDSVDGVSEHLAPDPAIVATMLAPVYLRRTQQDVLAELPERIHIDEWVDLSEDNLVSYLEALPHVMQDRLAATAGNGRIPSAKCERVTELVHGHQEAGHTIGVCRRLTQEEAA